MNNKITNNTLILYEKLNQLIIRYNNNEFNRNELLKRARHIGFRIVL